MAGEVWEYCPSCNWFGCVEKGMRFCACCGWELLGWNARLEEQRKEELREFVEKAEAIKKRMNGDYEAASLLLDSKKEETVDEVASLLEAHTACAIGGG